MHRKLPFMRLGEISHRPLAPVVAWLMVLVSLVLTACGTSTLAQSSSSGSTSPSGGAEAVWSVTRPFAISTIPDQEVAVLNRQFGAVASYLNRKTGLKVEYIPMVDYAALVTAFERGEIQLAWFGGLTAVQAAAVVPNAEIFAQRRRDAEFHSKFIVMNDLPVRKLEDLKGLTFTFGSESSTSGHLMPLYYLRSAGINADKDFKGLPNFSGSHDKTVELVQSGAFQAGALNEAVWERRVKEGTVDMNRVRAFYTTPAYFDYNWTIRGDVDRTFGSGAKQKVKDAILGMGPEQEETLKLFQTDKFIPSQNENYSTIRKVAQSIGIIR